MIRCTLSNRPLPPGQRLARPGEHYACMLCYASGSSLDLINPAND